MTLQVVCTDPAVVAGQPASACTSLVLQEETSLLDPGLSLVEVGQLLEALLFLLMLAWGFAFVRSFIGNKR